ncbi:hypothetical protein MKEN_01298800 [Mycena kentingensis (nom. inval.)]|nr:hypothetical protein MKEN_01298800 [Mycena kentingensis (nom. inval.)]
MSNSRPAHKGYSYLAQSPVWTDLREFIIQWPDVSDDAAKRLSKQAYRLVDASKDALRGFYASISAFTDPHATANLIAIGIVLDEMNSFYRFSHRGDDDWDWFDATLYDGRFSTPDPDDDQKIEHPSYSGYFPARNELQNMSLKNAVVPTKRKAVIEMPDTSADSDADELEEEEEDELESASDAEYYRPADDGAAEEDRVQFDSKPHSVSRVQKAVLRTGKLIPCLVVEGSLTAHSTLTKTKYTLVGPNTNFAALNKMPDIHIVPIDPEKRAPIPTGRVRPKHTFHQLLDSENISLMYAALTEMAEIKNYKNTQMVFPLETLAYKDDYAIGSTSKSDSAPIDPVFTPPPLISLKTGKALDDWQAFPRTSNCINCIAIGCLCASHGLGVACTSCNDGTGQRVVRAGEHQPLRDDPTSR